MKGDELKAKKESTIRLLVESVYILAHFFAPFIPTAAAAIFKKVQKEPVGLDSLKTDFFNLEEGHPVASSTILFEQITEEIVIHCGTTPPASPRNAGDEKKGEGNAGDKKGDGKKQQQGGEGKNEGKKQKGEKKQKGGDAGGDKKQKAPKNAPRPPVDMNQELYSRLDLRVGEIVDCEYHPHADRLYVEKIDVGEEEPRQIISGLREYYTLEEMKGRKIVTICNLKKSKLMKVDSHGMVLCAKYALPLEEGQERAKNMVQFARVPEGSKPGDPICVKGEERLRAPWDPKDIDKNKVWLEAANDMKTDENGICCFKGKPLVCNGEVLTSDYKGVQLS
jgi:methionine--tRNA ligase beta chain